MYNIEIKINIQPIPRSLNSSGKNGDLYYIFASQIEEILMNYFYGIEGQLKIDDMLLVIRDNISIKAKVIA